LHSSLVLLVAISDVSCAGWRRRSVYLEWGGTVIARVEVAQEVHAEQPIDIVEL
jgi:hypothetical protein